MLPSNFVSRSFRLDLPKLNSFTLKYRHKSFKFLSCKEQPEFELTDLHVHLDLRLNILQLQMNTLGN